MKTDPNHPVYPSHSRVGELETVEHCGLSKREWFTGMALEGLLSDHEQMRDFEESARKAAKQIHAERVKENKDADIEEIARESLDTLIAFRAVEIGDMTIHRLNMTDENPPAEPTPLEAATPSFGVVKS